MLKGSKKQWPPNTNLFKFKKRDLIGAKFSTKIPIFWIFLRKETKKSNWNIYFNWSDKVLYVIPYN
jgi:hypothetical protein